MKTNISVAIGSDHAGFQVKQHIAHFLDEKGYKFHDYGTYSDESTDYPDYAHKVACEVKNGNFDFGIVVCGSGNGVNMTVNKHQGIRSALCWNREIASVVRLHNDANICALPGRFISKELAVEIVEVFLSTGFEGGRHLNRINKIDLQKNSCKSC
jgi:ribose 5-phosphate isomerase B